MSINKISIKNFTVFESFELDFSPCMNVIVGENGTGKTHLMKLVDMFAKSTEENIDINSSAHYYFQCSNTELLKNKNIGVASININYDDCDVSCTIYNKTSKDMCVRTSSNINSIFIPAKDMLTHSKGFCSLYDARYIPFDVTYKNIVSRALLPNLKQTPDIGIKILPTIEKIIGGKVIVKDEVFYIEDVDGNHVRFSLVAEGEKKFALLWQLIANGSITKDSILLWDEPEANINPKLLNDIAEMLLELSRNGVQVIVSTHNYMFAKYVEVLMEDSDQVAFHSLFKTENGVQTKSSTGFTDLENNSIIASLDNLVEKVFDLEL